MGAIFKGPDSETVIKGPDGAAITYKAEGASVGVEEKLEPIVGPAPVLVAAPAPELKEEAILAEAEPAYLEAAPEIVALPEEEVKVAAEPVALEAKVEGVHTKLEGPSGSISTDGKTSIVSGPASTTITGKEEKYYK